MCDLPTGNWLLAGWVSSVWIAQDLPDFRLERFYNNYGDIFFGCHTHDCDRWFGNRKPNLLWGWDEASTWRWGLSHLQSHWGKRMRHLAREKGPPRFAWTVCADCAGEHDSSPICFLEEKGSDINQVSHWPLARLKTSIFGGHSLWGREKGAVWPESTTHSRPRGSICQLRWKNVLTTLCTSMASTFWRALQSPSMFMRKEGKGWRSGASGSSRSGGGMGILAKVATTPSWVSWSRMKLGYPTFQRGKET